MPTITIETLIEAPIDRVFDLTRSIDLHRFSTKETNERAIAGKTSGLIGPGEAVTWRAKHLGIYQNLSVVITEFNRPFSFTDRMLKGAFASMEHQHQFEVIDAENTLMRDIFTFRAPLGFLGRMAERLFLNGYMRRFLISKNKILKQVAESEEWKQILEK